MFRFLGALMAGTIVMAGAATSAQAGPILTFQSVLATGGTVSYDGTGGSLIGQNKLGVSPTYYWNTVYDALLDQEHLLPKDVYTGLAKALVFGCMIAVVACSTGLRASGGALGVGRAVQEAVKTSVLLIIVVGYILTWFFYFLL